MKGDIAQMCLCETKYQGGGIASFWGAANLSDKVSRDMGYRNDSIAISCSCCHGIPSNTEGISEIFRQFSGRLGFLNRQGQKGFHKRGIHDQGDF